VSAGNAEIFNYHKIAKQQFVFLNLGTMVIGVKQGEEDSIVKELGIFSIKGRKGKERIFALD